MASDRARARANLLSTLPPPAAAARFPTGDSLRDRCGGPYWNRCDGPLRDGCRGPFGTGVVVLTDRIVAALAKRVAAGKTPESVRGAKKRSIPDDRVCGVAGAGRMEAAVRAQQRRNPSAIQGDRAQQGCRKNVRQRFEESGERLNSRAGPRRSRIECCPTPIPHAQ